MNILIFCSYPFLAVEKEPLFCGGQYFPYYFSQALSRLRVKVSVIARREQNQPLFQDINGVKVYRFPSVYHVGGHRRGISFNLNRLKLTKKLLNKMKVDLAITFSPLFWELFPINRRDIPFCYMIPGVNIGFTANLKNTPLQLFRKLAIRLMSRPMLKINLLHSSLIFTFCDSDVSLAKNIYKPEGPVLKINNGVDSSKYKPVVKNTRFKEFLVIGRFSPEKGFHDVIEAAKKIKKYFPDMTLHLVGFVDNRAYLGRLKAVIKADGLSSWVQIETNVPESKIPDIFSNALACVVFSNGYDPLPSVIFQAMSCGIPVISTDWPPRREIIEHGKNGLLVPEGDTDLLSQQMHYLMSNPMIADQMGKTARETVISHRDFNMIARDFLSQLRCAA